MSRCDLDLWFRDLELLQHFGCRVLVFKLCKKIWVKSNTPRLSYWRFGTFSLSNFQGGGMFFGQSISRVRGLNFIKLGDDIERSPSLVEFVSELDILFRIEMQAAQMQLVSKLEFEFRAVGNCGFDRKWLLTTLRRIVDHHAKFHGDRATYGWFNIDVLAHCRLPILGGGALSPDDSQGCVDQISPNLERK